MIAIVRKNVAGLLCSTHKSSVSSSLSPHFFSWRETQSVACPRVYDLLLHKHQFSAEVASLVASVLKSPDYADSILSFLKESGFSTTQLEKIVKYRPRILSHNVEDIKFKIKIFHDLGLSPQETAKMVSDNKMFLHLAAEGSILPSLSVLKELLESDCNVARLLKKSAWPLCSGLGKTLIPNVEFLKSLGIPMERILFFLCSHPRCLLIKPEVMRKSVEKAKEMGFNESSRMFIHALGITTSLSEEMWRVKLQSFQEMGFSESDALAMFKKSPGVFMVSAKKIEKVKQLVLATGKFGMDSIVDNPRVLASSIELKLEPRLQILQILESKNLIKWPSLARMCTLRDDRFFDRFIRPYPNEVPEELVSRIPFETNLMN